MESGNTQAKLTTYFHAERIIHFYFSQEERLRFLRAFLVTPQKPARLIVGAQNEDLKIAPRKVENAPHRKTACTNPWFWFNGK
jgi:hypothetical protein